MISANQLLYIELKTGHANDGPAWICKTTASQSGHTIYFNNKALKKIKDPTTRVNHYDLETGEEYWVTGAKKSGEDRHFDGGGPVMIDEDCVDEYLSFRGLESLNKGHFNVVSLDKSFDIDRFNQLENKHL